MIFSRTYFHRGPFWEEYNTLPFNELILSWNGIRPNGKWMFWVSLNGDDWLKYAEWSLDGQRSFRDVGTFAQCHQDVVTPKEVATSFKIKVEGEQLDKLHRLTVCLSHSNHYKLAPPNKLSSIFLPHFPRQSQQVLPHPRAKDLCSPTATSTAISYICNRIFDPILFANRSHDSGFDIYGNWVLNIAEAYHQSQVPCYVERMPNFTALHTHLLNGRPVVVSVKGPIPGSPLPYAFGHLMCVIGFDDSKVYCMDPGFPDNESTFVTYELSDFLQAWSLRRNLAYIFGS